MDNLVVSYVGIEPIVELFLVRAIARVLSTAVSPSCEKNSTYRLSGYLTAVCTSSATRTITLKARSFSLAPISYIVDA